uniref:Uncharacterized protein n=1 Tax=Panagrolaimus davidi TaxID=227884 RepID=A0A914P9C9_9BILA
MIFFNDGGRAYQKFDALPKTIMDYSLKNLKPQHLIRKLELLEDIYFVDYKHLTKTETIQEVKIAGVYDRREFYYLSIEKIIAEVPTATSIETRVSVFKENSLNLLIALNRKVKIYNFVIKGIYGTFYVKADLLVDFFSKHGADNCNILLDLKLWPDQYNPYESNKTRTYDYTKRIAEVIAKKKETTIRNF